MCSEYPVLLPHLEECVEQVTWQDQLLVCLRVGVIRRGLTRGQAVKAPQHRHKEVEFSLEKGGEVERRLRSVSVSETAAQTASACWAYLVVAARQVDENRAPQQNLGGLHVRLRLVQVEGDAKLVAKKRQAFLSAEDVVRLECAEKQLNTLHEEGVVLVSTDDRLVNFAVGVARQCAEEEQHRDEKLALAVGDAQRGRAVAHVVQRDVLKDRVGWEKGRGGKMGGRQKRNRPGVGEGVAWQELNAATETA